MRAPNMLNNIQMCPTVITDAGSLSWAKQSLKDYKLEDWFDNIVETQRRNEGQCS